jgi:hypothetical protein
MARVGERAVLRRLTLGWAFAAGLHVLSSAAEDQFVPLSSYLAQDDAAADPAALGYLASRCSALYSVFAKNLEGEIDPERKDFRARALNAGEKFMGLAVQSTMSGTMIEINDALARVRNIIVGLSNIYTDRIFATGSVRITAQSPAIKPSEKWPCSC